MKQRLPTIEQIAAITDQYDKYSLECDGMTRVLHHYLDRAGIAHKIFYGSVRNPKRRKKLISPHFWINLLTEEGGTIIDYRARMWLGESESIPHGVFLVASYPNIEYVPESVVEIETLESVIEFLCSHIGPYQDLIHGIGWTERGNEQLK